MEGFGGDLGETLHRIGFVSPDVLKAVLWKVVLLLGITDLLLAITAVIHRVYVDRRERLYKEAYDKYSNQVIDAIFGEGSVDPPRGNVEKEALGDVCLEILKKFRGAFTEKVRQIAEGTGVVDYYTRRTRSFILQRRIVAYEKLAHLRIYKIKEEVRKELEKEEKEWAIGRLILSYTLLSEDFGDVEFVFESLKKIRYVSFKFVEFVWSYILDTFSEEGKLDELLSFVWERFSEKPFVLRAFVEAAGSKRIQGLGSYVLKIYERHREDVLMRISCVRSLGLMGFEEACDIISENLVHPDWRVRAVACRFSSICPWDRIGELLVERLKDESYHVRINAGKAILHFKNRAREVFEKLLSSEDRFARDTARYFLRELEVKNA